MTMNEWRHDVWRNNASDDIRGRLALDEAVHRLDPSGDGGGGAMLSTSTRARRTKGYGGQAIEKQQQRSPGATMRPRALVTKHGSSEPGMGQLRTRRLNKGPLLSLSVAAPLRTDPDSPLVPPTTPLSLQSNERNGQTWGTLQHFLDMGDMGDTPPAGLAAAPSSMRNVSSIRSVAPFQPTMPSMPSSSPRSALSSPRLKGGGRQLVHSPSMQSAALRGSVGGARHAIHTGQKTIDGACSSTTRANDDVGTAAEEHTGRRHNPRAKMRHIARRPSGEPSSASSPRAARSPPVIRKTSIRRKPSSTTRTAAAVPPPRPAVVGSLHGMQAMTTNLWVAG